jgi:hypothetical protein
VAYIRFYEMFPPHNTHVPEKDKFPCVPEVKCFSSFDDAPFTTLVK